MAKKARDAGFRKIKCAPFDGFGNADYENNEFIKKGIDNVSLIFKKFILRNRDTCRLLF